VEKACSWWIWCLGMFLRLMKLLPKKLLNIRTFADDGCCWILYKPVMCVCLCACVCAHVHACSCACVITSYVSFNFMFSRYVWMSK
jgi:hypothetical protein